MTYKDEKVKEALEIISRGECLIYPTETLYALGASALDGKAARRVYELKRRDANKPFPLIIGSWEQLSLVTNWSKEISLLAQAFWPGPLSILVPAHSRLSSFVKDGQGWTSVRWSSHPLAQQLCLQANVPLIATSANLSGQGPVAEPQELSPWLESRVSLVLKDKPWPSGGPPSTLVRLLDQNKIEILRLGAIGAKRLKQRGFEVIRGHF